MKILFVSAVSPYPLYSGGQVRIYNLLKQLSSRHEITLCSFIRSEEERKYSKELSFLYSVRMVYRGRAMEPRYLMKIFGKYPLLMETYNNANMRNLVTEELKNNTYDLVHIEPFYVYPSIPDISVPLVVGEHNIEHTVYAVNARIFPFRPLRPVLAADAQKVRVWEERVWKKSSAIVAVSEGDAQHIRKVAQCEVRVVPNGVDIQSFPYVSHAFNGKSPAFLFVGNFAWAPNQEAVSSLLKRIWPAISQKFPSATLTIVGQQFPNFLEPYCTKNVTVRRDVMNIQDAFRHSHILLAPMGIGGGTKFKILEAMASGTAVLTTKAGYMGIQAVPGTHLTEASTPEGFAAAAVSLFAKPKETVQMTRAARLLVEKQYDWKGIANVLDAVWRSQT